MTLGREDLVLGYMSMTHAETPPDGEWRFTNASFADRCAAAVAGGFSALGIVPSVYEDARAAGLTDDDLRAMLRDAGLVVTEVEMQHQIPGAGAPRRPGHGARVHPGRRRRVRRPADLRRRRSGRPARRDWWGRSDGCATAAPRMAAPSRSSSCRSRC